MFEFVWNIGSSIIVGLGTGIVVSNHFSKKEQGRSLRLHMLNMKAILNEIDTTSVFKSSQKTLDDLSSINYAAKKLLLEQRMLEVIDENVKQWIQVKKVIDANKEYTDALKKACADAGFYNRNFPLKNLDSDRLEELNTFKRDLDRAINSAVDEIK